MATKKRKPPPTSERHLEVPKDMRPIDSVRPDPKNARERTPRNLAAIRASLVEFGQQKPIVLDAEGIIRAGNGTWLVAKDLGWTEIWVNQTTLAGKRAAAFAIADNRTTDLSVFDEVQLAALLADLDPDLIEATGFDMAEVADLLPHLAGVDEVLAANGGTPSSASKMMDKQRAVVRVLVGCDNVEPFERAMQATGLANREAALMELANAYLEAQGQLHLHR